MLATFIGAGAQVKPVNGRNPLVVQAQELHLPRPFEVDGDRSEEDEWDDWEEWEDVDSEPMRDPQSMDEQLNGVNRVVPGEEELAARAARRKRRRMPPMPGVPKPKVKRGWVPPFEVLPDGTVTGPPLAADGSPPGDELPISIMEDGTRVPFDPPRGSMEGVTSILLPPGSRPGRM